MEDFETGQALGAREGMNAVITLAPKVQHN